MSVASRKVRRRVEIGLEQNFEPEGSTDWNFISFRDLKPSEVGVLTEEPYLYVARWGKERCTGRLWKMNLDAPSSTVYIFHVVW